ncbi:MAG: hypothetical protein WBO24_17135 [Nitrospirales bacterium]
MWYGKSLQWAISQSLYGVPNLFSRLVVARMALLKESSALSKQLMDKATARHLIESGQLTLPQDRA